MECSECKEYRGGFHRVKEYGFCVVWSEVVKADGRKCSDFEERKLPYKVGGMENASQG